MENCVDLNGYSVQRINLAAELVTDSFAVDKLAPVVDFKLLTAYCLCDLKNQVDCIKCNCNDQILSKSCGFTKPKLNKQRIDEACLETKMQELIYLLNYSLWDSSMVIIHGKIKIERKANSKRRSDFIGVSKNGPNWQSMISILKKKIYIGTYQHEREAAIAFDFYSILIHHFNAKTNFSYSKSMIMEMFINFRSNENVFVPSEETY